MPVKRTAKPARPTAKSAARPLPSEHEVREFLDSAGPTAGLREVARAFHIRGSDRLALKPLLARLQRSAKPDRGPGSGDSTTTVVTVTNVDADGDLWAAASSVAHDQDEPAALRLRATPEMRGTLGIGDRVLARIQPGDDDAIQSVAIPIKILPKPKTTRLGVIEKTGERALVQSIDKKDQREWVLCHPSAKDASHGDLVRFETVGGGRFGREEARVVERIGHPKSERAISLIAIHNHGLRHAFPDAVLAELKTLPHPTPATHPTLDLPLVTIDPADAKDHDDAVWAAHDPDPANPGGMIVVVAIADVSFYVRPGSALDQEARLRGNSVYFPDRVVPMLPETLSNDLCSLKEQVPRPCLAVEMVFDRDGTKLRHRFMRRTMTSAAKLSYQQAQAAIDGKPDAKTKPILASVLRPLWEAYAVLKKGRDTRAPLDLDLPERKIVLDERGLVADVIIPERLDAHKLIEEFMIQANVAAAEALEAKKARLIYRVHDAPSREKGISLTEFLATLGLQTPKTGFKRPSQFNRILERARGKDYEAVLNEVVLRSQAQAEYSTGNYGHFGLNLRRYAHFTSPIRRYADLVVHRALVGAYGFGPGGMDASDVNGLDVVAEDISQLERKAMSAERETVDRLIAMHLAERIGDAFEGRIAGVTRSGVFVKLKDTGADGFIPASTLGREYFRYAEAHQALVGERSGRAYRLGDRVEVRLREANPVAGGLRFEMLTDAKPQQGQIRMSSRRRNSQKTVLSHKSPKRSRKSR